VVTLVGDHRRAAEDFARELSERRDAEAVGAVLLHGSTVRGEAVEGSDVDLLVVTGDDDVELGRFHHRDGLVVDLVAHGPESWLERLQRPRPMWVYAFVEAEPLVDHGPGGRLVEVARRRYETYRTPEAVKAELADALWHGRAKLTRAQRGTDPEAGYWASVYLVGAIVEMLYAVADRPLPPGSRRFDLIGSLDLPEHQLALFEQLCAGPPRGRIAAAASLVDELGPLLGPPPSDPRTRPATGRGGLAR
jgi:predicted nucleotidyltransferase